MNRPFSISPMFTFFSPSFRSACFMLVLAVASPGMPAPPDAVSDVSVLEDPRVRELGRQGLDFLYNMQREQAKVAFDEIEALYPKHPIGPFLQGLNIWWDIMIDLTSDRHDKAFLKEMDEVVSRSNRMLKRNRDDFDAIFFKGAALGFSGRLRSNRGQWFRAARDGKNAMDYVMKIAERDVNNPDYLFGKGIYDYFSVVIPEKYPVVRPFTIFIPRGNRDRGLETLQRTQQEGYYIKTEAAYFLLQIYFSFENDYRQSLNYIQWLRNEHPGNSFFHAFEGRVYARWGRWSEAERIFESVRDLIYQQKHGYSDVIAEQTFYYLARARMVQRDFDQALTYLDELDAVLDPEEVRQGFGILGLLRRGMVFDARGERQKAIEVYRQVLDLQDWSGSHNRASRYLENPYRG